MATMRSPTVVRNRLTFELIFIWRSSLLFMSSSKVYAQICPSNLDPSWLFLVTYANRASVFYH
jgi:hypothetical protein